MQLAVVVVTCVPLGRMHMVEATTPNRAADGYSNSGYMWPKTLIWKGLRSSPGSLWLFYTVAVIDGGTALLLALGWQLQRNGMSPFEKAVSEHSPVVVAVAPLYVAACVNQLSDVVEAYLAGMVTVQLLIPSLLVQTGSRIPRLLLISGLQISAVLGTAMLDSYPPLDLLNLDYSLVGTLLLAGIVFTDMTRDPKRKAVCIAMACFVHMGFTIAAFIVADNVQGSHRQPMLCMLITACLFTLLSWPLVIAIIIRRNDENDDVL